VTPRPAAPRGRIARGARIAALVLAALGAACREQTTDLVLVGSVERTLVELVAPASETIMSIPVRRGERVAKGDEIVLLDPTVAIAEVASAEAELAGARTAAAVSAQDYARVRKLHGDNVASEQALDEARLRRDEAEARLRAARAKLAVAHKRLQDHTVLAPAPGVIDQLPFDPGERVPAGAVVAVLLDDSPPWVRVWLPERAHAWVGPGTRADVSVDGVEAPLEGRVLDVAREPEFTPHFALTERERVLLVYETRVEIVRPPPSLRPGTPAEVRIAPPATSRPDAPDPAGAGKAVAEDTS
jgi:HlyD family secretion protein